MHVLDKSEYPSASFLWQCHQAGSYTDCYRVEIERTVTLAEFIQAFYSTGLFQLERKILKWAVARPSTDQELNLLADSRIATFAAWAVDARSVDQILLTDFTAKTRSWLMTETITNASTRATYLYFGSVIVPARKLDCGKPEMRKNSLCCCRFTDSIPGHCCRAPDGACNSPPGPLSESSEPGREGAVALFLKGRISVSNILKYSIKSIICRFLDVAFSARQSIFQRF
jgi:hypothetical protein